MLDTNAAEKWKTVPLSNGCRVGQMGTGIVEQVAWKEWRLFFTPAGWVHRWQGKCTTCCFCELCRYWLHLWAHIILQDTIVPGHRLAWKTVLSGRYIQQNEQTKDVSAGQQHQYFNSVQRGLWLPEESRAVEKGLSNGISPASLRRMIFSLVSTWTEVGNLFLLSEANRKKLPVTSQEKLLEVSHIYVKPPSLQWSKQSKETDCAWRRAWSQQLPPCHQDSQRSSGPSFSLKCKCKSVQFNAIIQCSVLQFVTLRCKSSFWRHFKLIFSFILFSKSFI